jgi:hypothetical protein
MFFLDHSLFFFLRRKRIWFTTVLLFSWPKVSEPFCAPAAVRATNRSCFKLKGFPTVSRKGANDRPGPFARKPSKAEAPNGLNIRTKPIIPYSSLSINKKT